MDIKELIEKAFEVGHTIGYGNTENHYKPEFERWWNDENTQKRVKNCSIPHVVGQSEQCAHNNTEFEHIRCNVCHDCGEILETDV